MLIFLISLGLLALFMTVYLEYKNSRNLKQLTINLLYLGTIIALGVVGRVMHSISPLYIAQYIAIIVALAGFLYFIFRKRFIWWSLFVPIAVLALYLILAFTSGSGAL